MAENPLDYFKVKPPPKAKPVEDFRKQDANAADTGLNLVSSGKTGLKQVQQGRRQDESLRPRGHGEARRVAAQKLPNLDPETSKLVESALYMNSRDSKGNSIGPDTAVTDVRLFSVDPKTRDSIIAEFKKDPKAATEKYGAQRQAFRDVRNKTIGGAQNPDLKSQQPGAFEQTGTVPRPLDQEQADAEKLAPDFQGNREQAKDWAQKAARSGWTLPFKTVGELVSKATNPGGIEAVRAGVTHEMEKRIGRSLNEREMREVEQSVGGYLEQIGNVATSIVTGGATAAGATAGRLLADEALNAYPYAGHALQTLLDPNATPEDRKAAILEGALSSVAGTHVGRSLLGKIASPVTKPLGNVVQKLLGRDTRVQVPEAGVQPAQAAEPPLPGQQVSDPVIPDNFQGVNPTAIELKGEPVTGEVDWRTQKPSTKQEYLDTIGKLKGPYYDHISPERKAMGDLSDVEWAQQPSVVKKYAPLLKEMDAHDMLAVEFGVKKGLTNGEINDLSTFASVDAHHWMDAQDAIASKPAQTVRLSPETVSGPLSEKELREVAAEWMKEVDRRENRSAYAEPMSTREKTDLLLHTYLGKAFHSENLPNLSQHVDTIEDLLRDTTPRGKAAVEQAVRLSNDLGSGHQTPGLPTDLTPPPTVQGEPDVKASTTAEPSTSPVPETPGVQTETPASNPQTLEGSPVSPPVQETSVPLTQPKVTRTVQDIDAEIAAVRQRMDQRAKPLPGGKRAGAATKVGPDDIKDAVTLGRLHFEKGLRTFEDWSREMIGAFGTAIRQHLPDIWKQVSGPVTGDSVDRLQQALGEATVLRSDFAEQLSSKARSQRAGKLAGAQASSVGKPFGEAMGKQMGSQKGSFANYSFELPAPIDAEDLAHLKDMVLTHPQLRPYDKLNAQLALEKIAGDGQYGGVPTSGEISALEKVFGKGIGTRLRTMQAPSIWEEVVMLRKAGLLSGPRTILRNFIGNAANAARNEGLRPFDAISDQLVRFAFPKATDGRRTVAAGLGWSADRSLNVAQKTAQDVKDVLKHGQDWGGSAEVFKESRNPIVKYALRFQGAQDSVWMNAAYERSLFEQASLMKKKNPSLDLQSLLDNPTEAMDVQAQFDSQVSTFNAPNKLAESVQSLTKIPGLGPVIEFLIPFKRVPSNIGSEIAQANPAGALFNWFRAVSEAKQTGSLSYATQRQLAKQTTNGALGTGLLWMGAELARQGKLTGSAPVDPAQKTTNEALGVRPASLQVGDSRYQLTGTHPFMSVIALGASMYEAAQRRHDQAVSQSDRLSAKGLKPEEFGAMTEVPKIDPLKDAGSWAVAFGSIMQEQSFLKGIKDVVDSAQSERQVQSFVNNAVSSFAPVIVNDAMRTVGKGDDVVRDPSNIGEAFRSRLGFGKDIPAKRDAFGREIKLGGVFDVTNAKEVRADPVSRLMKNNGLTVTKLQRLSKEPADHYQRRQQLYGQFLYHVLSQAEPSLSGVTDRKVLKEVWERLTGAVRSKLDGGLNTDVLEKVNAPQSTRVPAGG